MRVEGWEGLLHEHLRAASNATFQWGAIDCALWCGDWVYKVTGNDFISAWRGKYVSEPSLKALMTERGFDSPEMIADATGFHVLAIPFARRGDVMLHPQGCLGICDGLLSYFLTEASLFRVKTLSCKKAWKID